jgi:hypothetical protein
MSVRLVIEPGAQAELEEAAEPAQTPGMILGASGALAVVEIASRAGGADLTLRIFERAFFIF